jgi:hypothetical protein
MTLETVYQASRIRTRATKEGVLGRREHLYNIIAEMKPMTVRQVFYQATVRNVVEKSEAGYNKIQPGTLPYDWLADNTRWQRGPRTFNSVQDALDDTARFYRKSLWADVERHLPRRQFEILKAAEASEREIIQRLVGGLGAER